jgi:DNA polymerase-1
MNVSMPSSPVSPLAIDYVVDGPRTAAAVAAGKARLLGMTYQSTGQQPRFVAEDLAAVLSSFGDRPRVYPDSLFALALEMRQDLPLPGVFEDTHIMLRLLGEEADPAGDKPGRDRSALAQASIERVQATYAQHTQLVAQIAAEGLDTVYREIELPVIAPTISMTLSGVRVNKAKLEQLKEGCEIQMQIAARQLQELAGWPINPDSTRELVHYLYGQLGVPAAVYTSNDTPSTAIAALEPLADRHPAVKAVLKYSENKPVRNAAKALLDHAQPSGLVYANLDPLGASTGRFSCESPNLQGIPGRLLEAVEASPGRLLLEADYSQCELRVLAHFSQDPRLLAAYSEGIDVHLQTASAVLGIPVDEVKPEERKRFGKEINFAIIYGMTQEGLAQQIGIPAGEAQTLLDAYFVAYPGVQQWIAQVHDAVRAQGHVRTLYGRRRKLPGIWSPSYGDVAQALRRAVNTIVQGTAADLIKLSLVRLHDVLPAEVRMLMTAHDSVLLELPEPLLEETRQIVRNAMETLPSGFTVPLKVDLGIGHTWAECKEKD